jgi:hypothetical protein
MNITVLNMKGEEFVNTDKLETIVNDYLLKLLNQK